MKNQKNIFYGLINSIIFPFRYGVFIYNILLLFFTMYLFLNIAKLNSLFFSESSASFLPVLPDEIMSLLPEVDKMMVNHNFIISNYSFGLSKNAMMNYPTPLVVIFLIFLLVGLLTSIRNFDISVQISTDQSQPVKLNPNYYGSFLLSIKYIILNLLLIFVWCLIISAVVALVSSIKSSEFFIVLEDYFIYLIIICVVLYPASIITLIYSYSLVRALCFVDWLKSIFAIGIINYFLMLIALSLVFGLTFLMDNYFDKIVENQAISIKLLTYTAFLYLTIHLTSSVYYILGFFMNKSDKLVVKSAELHSDMKNIKKIINSSTSIEAAQKFVSEGKIDLAAETVNKAISEEKQYHEKMKLYRMLINTYKTYGRKNLVIETENKLIDDVVANHYEYFVDVAGILLDRVDNNENNIPADFVYTLMKIARDRKRYETLLKISKGFVKKYPNHFDVVNIYILVGRVLIEQKKYDQARTLLKGLYNSYPDDTKAPEVEHLLNKLSDDLMY